MNRNTQIISLVIALGLIGCSDDSTDGTGGPKAGPAVEVVSLKCTKGTPTSSYSFELGKGTSKGEADINFYFDADDCSQGALFGQDDSKGYIFPVGHKTWDELPLDDLPQETSESVVGFRPITKDREGQAFWVRTKGNQYALVRIKSVQPAAFSDFESGKSAQVELEWTWGLPDKGTE